MTEKIKRFFGKYLIFIMFFVLICIGVVYLIISQFVYLYLLTISTSHRSYLYKK